jgi:uncharacterized protein (TIRG00374 family)
MALTPTPPASGFNARRWGGYLFRILSVIVTVWLIFRVVKSSGADMKQEWRECDGSSLILAFFFMGVGAALSSFRWARLLAVQGVVLSSWDAIKLTMIGVFFNVAIPGGVGGDLVKMYKLKDKAGHRFPEAVMTTLFDRILGLLGLFIVALAAVVANWDFLSHTQNKDIQRTVTFVATVAVVGGTATLMALYHELLFKISFVRSLILKVKALIPHKIWHLLGRVVRSISLFRHHILEVFLALAISVLIHTLTAGCMWAIGQAVHAPILQLRDYFLATQIANTISAVPLTPGGLGARDWVLSLFFKAAGEGPKAGVIPAIYSLLVILWSLIGSLFYFIERQHLYVPLATAPAPHAGGAATP